MARQSAAQARAERILAEHAAATGDVVPAWRCLFPGCAIAGRTFNAPDPDAAWRAHYVTEHEGAPVPRPAGFVPPAPRQAAA